MEQNKPWSDAEIAALHGNIPRKLAVAAIELFKSYYEMNFDIDADEGLTPQQQIDWLLYSEPLLAQYEASLRDSIARTAEI